MSIKPEAVRKKQGRVPACNDCGVWDCQCVRVDAVQEEDENPFDCKKCGNWECGCGSCPTCGSLKKCDCEGAEK